MLVDCKQLLLKAIYSFNSIPIKVLMGFFTKIRIRFNDKTLREHFNQIINALRNPFRIIKINRKNFTGIFYILFGQGGSLLALRAQSQLKHEKVNYYFTLSVLGIVLVTILYICIKCQYLQNCHFVWLYRIINHIVILLLFPLFLKI